MFKFIVAILFIAIHTLSLYGYGYFFQKIDRPLPTASWSIAVILGLGCWIFLGGVLNLLDLAYPWALNTMVVVGLGLSLLAFFRRSSVVSVVNNRLWAWFADAAPHLSIIVAVGVFVVATLMPSAAFNYYDDFHNYMAYPLRMLQTGTLFGSSFNSLGIVTLGGQSFLQGFVLSYFPPQYINGFDLFFGLLVCMLLLLDNGIRLGTPSAIIFLAILSVVFISPQYVNVSSLYSGSALLLALTLFTVTRMQATTYDRRSDIFTGIVVALLYSSLVALKASFLFYIAMHFVFFIAALAIATRDTMRMMRIALTVMLASALFISPWLLLYLPLYLTAVQTAFASSASVSDLASIVGRPDIVAQQPLSVNLLSTDPLFYGDSFAIYTFAVCLVVYYAMLVWVRARAQQAALKESRAIFAATGAAVFATYIVFIYVLAPHLFISHPEVWLRYFCPILIGTLPAALLISGHFHVDKSTRVNHPKLMTALLVLPTLIMMWTFSSSLNDRARQAYNYGSILAFSHLAQSPEYLSYNNFVLNGTAHRYVEGLQDMVPPNEQLIAWISMPLHLNYARNRILDVNYAGLASPWVNLNDERDYGVIKRYFQSLHVKYILWEYQGYGIYTTQSRLGINSLHFRNMLTNIADHKNDVTNSFDNVIFNDGHTALLRIEG